MTKRKAVNFEIIPRSQLEPYAVLEEMRQFHLELDGACIGLAWRKDLKSDRDGKLVLGKCVKISGLHREMADYDFVIVLNREMWSGFTLEQRKALVDHELCHAAPDEDDDGLHKRDEKSRPLWRIRKHDIEEFREIIERHGCYKRDLEQFAKAIQRKHETPLFDTGDPEVAILHDGQKIFEGNASDLRMAADSLADGDGAALASAAVMGGTHQKGTRKKDRGEKVN